MSRRRTPISCNSSRKSSRSETIQEVVTLTVFCFFTVFYLNEPLKWNYILGFVFIAGGALLVFAPWQQAVSP